MTYSRREFGLSLAALLAPLPFASAQAQRKIPRLGVLSWWSESDDDEMRAIMVPALRELGHVDGVTISLTFRWSNGNSDRARAHAVELVRSGVDVIFAQATPAGLAAKHATMTIPIVVTSADPVGAGLVTNLARPGANITGAATLSTDIAAKRLQLLREVVPRLRRVAFLGSTHDPNALVFAREIEAAAAQVGIAATRALVADPSAFDATFADMARNNVGAIIVQPLFIDHRAALARLALRHRMPMISDRRSFAEAGGLLAYGVSPKWLYRRAASYVDRILKGAKPGELPVEQPTTLELIVNLKTAAAIGVTIPPSVTARADEMIE